MTPPLHHLVVDCGDRLDRFLARALPHLSRHHLRELLAMGQVRVNHRRARKGERVNAGDVVLLSADVVETRTLRGQSDLPIAILAEDDGWVAVDKPAGIPSVAQRVTDLGTVSNYLVARYPETAALDVDRAVEGGVVHRLDTATSGVLLAARDSATHRSLRRQFSAHSVRKLYRAVVVGAVGRGGEISRPIRSRGDAAERVEVVDAQTAGARPAVTAYRPLHCGQRYSALEIEIRTGVRHQIRAHLAAIGHPVLGDALYGGGGEARLFLHASELSFTAPHSGEPVTVRSPLPPEFAAAQF